MLKGMRKVVFVVCVVSENLWNWFSELVVSFVCCHDVNVILEECYFHLTHQPPLK